MSGRPWLSIGVVAVLMLAGGALVACASSVDGVGDSPTPHQKSTTPPSTSATTPGPSSVSPVSQQPTTAASPAPEGFFKELDDRATATGVHAGTEVDDAQISVWFKGDPGPGFRAWAQAQRAHGQVIVIHVDAAWTKVEMLAAMDRLTEAGYFEPGKPPMPELMTPDLHGRGVVLTTDNYTPSAEFQADLERTAGMPVIIVFGKLYTLGE